MKNIILFFIIILLVGSLTYADEIGIASWYSVASSSNMTASGERFKDDGYKGIAKKLKITLE